MLTVNEFLQNGSFFSTKDGKVTLGWGERFWDSKPFEKGVPSFYFPDYFISSTSRWTTHEYWITLSTEQLLDLFASSSQPSQPPSLKWQKASKTAFKSRYDLLQEKIGGNILQKGVPYIFETSNSTYSTAHLRQSFLSILKTIQKHPFYGYGFWEENEGILGATPELLFASSCPENRTITSMACAGTQNHLLGDSSFLENPKERFEHQMVIQGIQDSIRQLQGKLSVAPIEILRLPRLTHLLTPLKVYFSSPMPFETLVKALHPTPALGAYPYKTGKQWLLEENALQPRHRFGAPIGFLDPSGIHSICAVAIRNIQWNCNQISMGAGCGVVSSSDFEKEWGELQLKIRSIKTILTL